MGEPEFRVVKMMSDIWDPAGVTGGLALRDGAGRTITVEWGEPDAMGFYEPWFTVSGSTEAERLARAEALRETGLDVGEVREWLQEAMDYLSNVNGSDAHQAVVLIKRVCAALRSPDTETAGEAG